MSMARYYYELNTYDLRGHTRSALGPSSRLKRLDTYTLHHPYTPLQLDANLTLGLACFFLGLSCNAAKLVDLFGTPLGLGEHGLQGPGSQQTVFTLMRRSPGRREPSFQLF